jgi:exopolysaccharide biosynthesis predicted pyruvyltransferase EpsI
MSLRHHRHLVEDVLRASRNKTVLYFPNGGNAGDSLISLGVMQCFDRIGVRFRHVGVEADVSNQTVVLGGGGNLVPAYEGMARALKHFHEKAHDLILLPHTIRGNEQLLAMLGANVTIICRDAASYAHVASICSRPTVLLGHDMAFHVDVDAFLYSDRARDQYQSLLSDTLSKRNTSLECLQALDPVYFARHDAERAGPIGGSHLDLSSAFAFGVTAGKAEPAAWCFLESVRTMKAIVTDRLHVGIAAALVGTPCVLRDNAYGKNAEIYMHSMKYYFRNVLFADSANRASAIPISASAA